MRSTMSSAALTEPATPTDPQAETLAALAARLGHEFSDVSLLELAVRHRSWCAENGAVESNERLEFLGDSVLGLVATDHLFLTGPELPEGVLARRRAELVNARVLTELALSLDLGSAVRLGRGEESTGGREKASILADAMEAVLGAVYLDGGLPAARIVILDLLDPYFDIVAGGPGTDFKSRLQELSARRLGAVPFYEVEGTGPDHDRWFEATVGVGGDVVGRGGGRSKKQAEQAAAAEAWQTLGAEDVVNDDGGEDPDEKGAGDA
jgi:ribonuclease-3